ncbi:Prophage CP4-57 regulatory protein (AlpA) [compost metagenome]
MTSTVQQPRCIWRLPTVKARTGLGRTTIYYLMMEGRFPKSRRIAGAHAVGWDSLEVERWIAEQLGEVVA